jgi:hypothetical protein
VRFIVSMKLGEPNSFQSLAVGARDAGVNITGAMGGGAIDAGGTADVATVAAAGGSAAGVATAGDAGGSAAGIATAGDAGGTDGGGDAAAGID